MKTIYKRFGQIMAFAGLLGVMLVASGSAMAATYNIIFKTAAGVIRPCATGGVTFTRTIAGTFDTTNASAQFSAPFPCFGVPALRTFAPGNLDVIVANVTAHGQDHGPNVVSLTGNLTSGGGGGGGGGGTNYTITFNADKTFTVNEGAPHNTLVGSGIYHVVNQASIPEPETLWLALAGLSALVLSRRMRRRV